MLAWYFAVSAPKRMWKQHTVLTLTAKADYGEDFVIKISRIEQVYNCSSATVLMRYEPSRFKMYIMICLFFATVLWFPDVNELLTIAKEMGQNMSDGYILCMKLHQ